MDTKPIELLNDLATHTFFKSDHENIIQIKTILI